jgi:hypothetical protein
VSYCAVLELLSTGNSFIFLPDHQVTCKSRFLALLLVFAHSFTIIIPVKLYLKSYVMSWWRIQSWVRNSVVMPEGTDGYYKRAWGGLIPRLAHIPSYTDSQSMGSLVCTSNFKGAINRTREGNVFSKYDLPIFIHFSSCCRLIKNYLLKCWDYNV